MKLTVATWNMDHWKRTPAQRKAAWERLRGSDIDVALLQETVPPADVPRHDVVWREIGHARRFGSAVVSLRGWPIEEITTAKSCYSYLAFPLLGTFPGSVAVARVHPPGTKPVTFVSVYGVIDVYSTTTLLRQIADLTPLFDSAHGERVVLGGDLNISTQSSGDELKRTKAVLGAIESLGLVDLFRSAPERPRPYGAECTCQREDCYHVGTHRNAARAEGTGSHLDYLFVSEALSARCKRLRLDEDPAIWELSDHCPVVAELDLEEKTAEPDAWDERFASDVDDTLRSVLSEPREWGAWKPGFARPVVRTDRALTKWIAAFWEGTLSDGRVAQLEIGIWREGGELGAHAGILAKPMGAKLDGLEVVVPPDSVAKLVSLKHADYVVVPLAEGVLPEREARAALDALVESAQLK